MLNKNNILKNVIQIYSLVIKDLKLKFRFKADFIVENLLPFLALFFPFIIFNTLFEIDNNFFKDSYYSTQNYILFLLLAYSIECSLFLLWYYRDLFYDEKIWRTLNGLMVAPTNRFNILIGFMISGLITRSFSIIITIVICFILFPIPIWTLLMVILVLICILVIFAGLGFILGLFEIVNENISATLTVAISFISLVSCLFYPIDIFPDSVHFIILLNPLYYYFDLLRLVWWSGIDFENAMKYITIIHIFVVSIFTIIIPIIASYLFLKIYTKYGSSGY